MDKDQLWKTLGRVATGISIAGGILSISHTLDEQRNGVRLREDQMNSIVDQVSCNVAHTVTDYWNKLVTQTDEGK